MKKLIVQIDRVGRVVAEDVPPTIALAAIAAIVVVVLALVTGGAWAP